MHLIQAISKKMIQFDFKNNIKNMILKYLACCLNFAKQIKIFPPVCCSENENLFFEDLFYFAGINHFQLLCNHKTNK